MAIGYAHIMALLELKKVFTFPAQASMLELGEQNWFGDVNPADIGGLIDKFTPGDERELLKAELARLVPPQDAEALFKLARLFYRVVLGVSHYEAIDLHGSPAAMKQDLNEPVTLAQRYDIVTNFGTAEHVFNIAQVFRTMHEAVKPGGLLLHALPNQGAYDHGFYNFHPTFVFDLAQANDYMLKMLFYVESEAKPPRFTRISSREDYVRLALAGRLAPQSGMLAFMVKKQEAPFAVPRQGYYDESLSPELRQAWQRMPR